MERPDWAFGQWTPEAVAAKRAYYVWVGSEIDRRVAEKRARKEARPRRLNLNTKRERNLAIWRERKEQGTTLQVLGEKYGIGKERVRQIVAKEDRRIRFAELRKQRETEGASSSA